MRSTIKQQNKLLDQIKLDTGLKSRKSALEFLYSNIAPSFKKKGYSLSHYKDGCFQITKDNFRYFTIRHDDLYTPLSTIISIERAAQ